MTENTLSATITPERSLNLLSQLEINQLQSTSQGGLYDLFRRCSLAVLNCGNKMTSGKDLLDMYQEFEIRVVRKVRGIKLEVVNAPEHAFVDGKMIKGIKEHLFSVLRDLIYISNEIESSRSFDLKKTGGITNAVFHILRNAGILKNTATLNTIVCWGGHSISLDEYHYSETVGYELGMRGLSICTGCGPGAMKGPMKGATIAHAQQRLNNMRYIGISEPGIIAVESPNPIVTDLVIMPDIEKRLEAFVRVGHGIIIFPGGAGTTEEILYLLGILLHPKNSDMPFPVILSGPKKSEPYFRQVDAFVGATLGDAARKKYRIIIDDPAKVARTLKTGIQDVREYRKERSDAFFYNWHLNIEKDFQLPFKPTHENMAALEIKTSLKSHRLAANLRKLFSGIVAGNLKEQYVTVIEEQGPFQIQGDPHILEQLDKLLISFEKQNRMKLPGARYEPCYKIV